MTTTFVVISKIILAIINIFYFFIGLAFFFLVAGEVVLEKLLDTNLGFAIALTWITAFLIIVTSITGCCLACNENKHLILTYAIFVLIALVLQTTVSFTISTKLSGSIDKVIKKEINNFNKLEPNSQRLIQEIQQQAECCGYENSGDYINGVIPNSCCGTYDKNRSPNQSGNCDPILVRKVKGCKDKLIEIGEKQMPYKKSTMYITSAIYYILQFTAVALSFGMVYSIKRDEAAKFQQSQNIMRQF